MLGYMINFGVYTMAMVGLIGLALIVYKKSAYSVTNKKSSLKIDEKIALNARKSLYVVNAGGERFLIAGDMENTSLIAKLGSDSELSSEVPVSNPIKFADELKTQAFRKQFIGRENLGSRLPEFAPEVKGEVLGSKKTFSKGNMTAAPNSLDKAFGNVTPIAFKTSSVASQAIGKKPVMKELARKLAEI